MKFSILFFSLLIGALCQQSVAPATRPPYDFYVLELIWPVGAFVFNRQFNLTPSPGHFTIHGLWPTRNHGAKSPEFCSGDKDLATVVGGLGGRLETYWPSLKGPNGNLPFWLHEWEKHGSCAWQTPALQGKDQYFQKTLDLYRDLNLDDALRIAKLAPTNTGRKFDVEEFTRDLNAHYESNSGPFANAPVPMIECHQQGAIQYLLDVRFCFDLNLQPTACPASVAGKMCDPGKVMYFPKSL